MTKVPIAKITTDRTLVNEAGLNDLAQEIKEAGKVEPILLRKDLTLIDGLRRLEAVKLLGWSNINADMTDDIVYAIGVLAKAHGNSPPTLRRMYEFHQQLIRMNFLRLQRLKDTGQWITTSRPESEQGFVFNEEVWKAYGLPYRSVYNRAMKLYKRSLEGDPIAGALVYRVELGEMTIESASNKYYGKMRKPLNEGEGHVHSTKEQLQLLDVGLRNIGTMVTAIDTIGHPILVPVTELAEYATQADRLHKDLRRISRRLKRTILESK